MMHGPLAAARFLTRLRLPGRATTAADLPAAVAWFPLVGAACNAAVAGAYLLAASALPAPVAAVMAVAAGLLLTGAFHEDAVADSADGLGGGGGDRARVLAICRDSRIGTYGAAALWVVLALRAALLPALAAAAGGAGLVLACACAGAWGRWTAVPLLALPSAAPVGLAHDVGHGQPAWVASVAVAQALACTALAWWCVLPGAVLAAALAVLATVAWGVYLLRRLGGQCGDLLGAGNQVVEALVLLTILASCR